MEKIEEYYNLNKIIFFLLILNFSFLSFNCSRRFEPEPLQLTVKQNLALLQSDPQFVMYFNFKKMRDTEFWKKFMSDSIINSERNFGSFLNTLKTATGASISNGIDELYFSNSWIGENAMVVKGTFDKNKINDYIKTDTNYSKQTFPDNITVYTNLSMHFYFYFKDDFTVCSSNYLDQLQKTFNVKDTTRAGLLTNENAIRTIENIKYKDNLWMMSNQKLFIRAIFENFANMSGGKEEQGYNKLPGDSSKVPDTTNKNGLNVSSFYQKVNAVSFSIKMSDGLELVMQNMCDDINSANELKNRTEAIIALAKLSAQLSKKKSPEIIKLFDNVDIKNYDNDLVLETKIDEHHVENIRKQKIF